MGTILDLVPLRASLLLCDLLSPGLEECGRIAVQGMLDVLNCCWVLFVYGWSRLSWLFQS